MEACWVGLGPTASLLSFCFQVSLWGPHDCKGGGGLLALRELMC